MQTIQSVGIDIAKHKFDVAIVRKDNTSVLNTYPNDSVGINHFVKELTKQGTDKSVPCIVESTGMYHFPVAIMVSNAGFRVNCINPLITKKHQRSSIRNAKTDPIDALRLANIGITESNLHVFKPEIRHIEARKLASYIGKLHSLKRQLKASTKAVLDMYTITGLSVDLSSIDKALREIDEQIKMFQKEIISRAPKEAHEVSSKTKGVSTENASILFSMIGDKDFQTRDSLVAFVGLDVMPRESGTWRGKGRLSKRGNSYLRKVLFQMAWGLKKYNEEYKKRYEELRKNGKDYRTTLIILARKFLRMIYGMYFKQRLSTENI